MPWLLALSAELLLVKRHGALPGHEVHKLGGPSFRMNALFSLRRCFKVPSGGLAWSSTFSLPSASLLSFSWHRTLADVVFSTHTEDLLTSPIRSLCQLISCFQTIYLSLSWLLFAGSRCLLFFGRFTHTKLGCKVIYFYPLCKFPILL